MKTIKYLDLFNFNEKRTTPILRRHKLEGWIHLDKVFKDFKRRE